MRILRFLLVIVLLGVAGAQQKSGNVSFTAPKGWVSSSMQGGVQYTHKGSSGEVDGLIMVGQDMPVPDSPADWVEQRARAMLQGNPVGEQEVKSEKLANGLTSTYKVLVGGTQAKPLYYVVVLLNNSTSGVLVVLLTSEASKVEAFAREVDALSLSVKFTGAPTTATTKTPAGNGTASNLPEVKPMNAAQFKAAGGNPEMQFIPDEFRCYVERRGEGLTPDMVIQMLPGGQYRTKYGNGTLTVKQDRSLQKILGTSGPLKGATGYLEFGHYGQQFELNDVGETDDQRGVDMQCYQRGPRENLALFNFKQMTPKPGKLPCTLDDGKGTPGGTLELQSGGRYTLNGQAGKFTTSYRNEQDRDYSSLDFTDGPLDNRLGSYEENEFGVHEVSFTRPSMTCKILVKPTPAPSRYGANKAPAPPKGSGGLSGNWVHSRAGNLVPGLQMGPDFTSSMVLNSECPGNTCWEFLFFNKSGYVFTGEPDESASETDCSRTHPNGLPICEVYRVTGGKIQIGDDKAVPFKQQGKTFTLDKQEYDQLTPLDHLKLDGQFKSTIVTNAVLAVGGTISNASLYFDPKNRFAYDRSSSTNLSGTGYFASVSNQAATSSGTYQFKGNTLELKYRDGRVVRLFAVTALDGKGKLALNTLRLGGVTYYKQDGKK